MASAPSMRSSARSRSTPSLGPASFGLATEAPRPRPRRRGARRAGERRGARSARCAARRPPRRRAAARRTSRGGDRRLPARRRARPLGRPCLVRARLRRFAAGAHAAAAEAPDAPPRCARRPPRRISTSRSPSSISATSSARSPSSTWCSVSTTRRCGAKRSPRSPGWCPAAPAQTMRKWCAAAAPGRERAAALAPSEAEDRPDRRTEAARRLCLRVLSRAELDEARLGSYQKSRPVALRDSHLFRS